MKDEPYSLMSELEKVSGKGNPPVHLWHPEVEKDIDLVVKRDGTWLYMGTPIKRPRLVRLFSSVLRKEGDEYFLVTPVEKCRIQVEDTPFQVVLMDVSGSGKNQLLTLTSDMGEVITADGDHPLRIEQHEEQWIPYVLIRDGMEGRLTRSVYYQLADLLVAESGWLGVWSKGEFFPFMKDA